MSMQEVPRPLKPEEKEKLIREAAENAAKRREKHPIDVPAVTATERVEPQKFEPITTGSPQVEVREMNPEEEKEAKELLGEKKKAATFSNYMIHEDLRSEEFAKYLDSIIPEELRAIVFAGDTLVGVSQTSEQCDAGEYTFTLRRDPKDIKTEYTYSITDKQIAIMKEKYDKGEYLDRDQLATVADALSEGKGNVDKRMQEIIDNTEVNPDAPLESKSVNVPIGGDPLDYAIREDDEGVHIDLDLLASEFPGAEVKPVDFESDRVKESILDKATGTFNMSDEEAFEFYMLVKQFKANPKMKIKISDLPQSMRIECAKQVQEVGGSITDYDMFAQLLVQTFTSEIEQNEVFIDIERELDEALKIPSMMDMFFEHSHQMAHEHIPAMISKCEEAGDTERADLLRRVGQSIDDAFSMKPLIEYYKNTTRVRKACRRDIDKVKNYINVMNYNNEKTKFKMQDATGMLTAMSKVFIEDAMQQNGEPTFYEDQIIKFVILVCCQCSEMDANSIVSATYMYYLMKNVISLTYVEEAKTEFARQLIDNISDVMSTIIDEEAEFYAANPKREGKQKRSKRSKH